MVGHPFHSIYSMRDLAPPVLTGAQPLSNIFSATPKCAPNPFNTSNSHLAKSPNFKIAEDTAASPAKSASIARKPIPLKHAPHDPVAIADSGYYGSQSQDAAIDVDAVMGDAWPPQPTSPKCTLIEPKHASVASAEGIPLPYKQNSTNNSHEETLDYAEDEEVKKVDVASPAPPIDENSEIATIPASSPVHLLGNDSPEKSPTTSSPSQPQLEGKAVPAADTYTVPESIDEIDSAHPEAADVTRSPSDGSSPIRPLVRKSSLNFASLPAREPLTSNKSLGARMSRTSHIDQNRASYYPRLTGGKSLGVRQGALEDDDDAMNVDEDDAPATAEKTQSALASHNKTYTQRLQDQISMLGKSQAGGTRPSKSIANLAGTQQSAHTIQAQSSQQALAAPEDKPRSPPTHQHSARTPGAFPEDDDDDWIAPPTTKPAAAQSPRPGIGKSHSADIMEGLHSKYAIVDADIDLPQDEMQEVLPKSPIHSPPKQPPLSRWNKSALGHGKSVSVPDLSCGDIFGQSSVHDTIRKPVSVSNPLVDSTRDVEMAEPSKSPSRSFRDSPFKQNALKQVKNKFSSILKSSKGILASSAALSAEGKAALVSSPSIARFHKQNAKSTESLVSQKEEEPLYPDLTKHVSSDLQPAPISTSSVQSISRKTRASAERDRRDQKQRDKEEKEAQHLAEQMEKLEKAREKEREKARVFSKEKVEKMATEKQATIQKEQEKATLTPAPKDAMKPTRTSPRKAQAQLEVEGRTVEAPAESQDADEDVDMADAPANKPAPPSLPRPIPGQTLKTREIKRPMKPTRETAVKPKQAPTLIRVNTSSQHPGLHPSNSVLGATLQDTLGTSQQQVKAKTSQPSMQTKTSSQNLKSSVNSTTGRPKALELAEKRRQEEEKKAQRRRDLKAEMERKREEDRRQEEERREKDRQRAAAEEEAKKTAARQAAIEKAKHTKAPPPAVRSQPNGPPAAVTRPPSRLGQSTTHRSQEDTSRPVNAVLSSSTAKMSMKRPLQQEGTDTGSRSGPFQQKEVKRMRMSDEFDPEEEMEIQSSHGTRIKGPPVRPSAGFKKVSRVLELFCFTIAICSFTY